MGRAVVFASECEGPEIELFPYLLNISFKNKIETFSQFQEMIFTHRPKTRREENILLHLIDVVLD